MGKKKKRIPKKGDVCPHFKQECTPCCFHYHETNFYKCPIFRLLHLKIGDRIQNLILEGRTCSAASIIIPEINDWHRDYLFCETYYPIKLDVCTLCDNSSWKEAFPQAMGSEPRGQLILLQDIEVFGESITQPFRQNNVLLAHSACFNHTAMEMRKRICSLASEFGSQVDTNEALRASYL